MIHKRISHLRGSLLYVSLVYRQTASVKVEAEAFEFDDFAGQTYFEFGVLSAEVCNFFCRQHPKVEEYPRIGSQNIQMLRIPTDMASSLLVTEDRSGGRRGKKERGEEEECNLWLNRRDRLHFKVRVGKLQ